MPGYPPCITVLGLIRTAGEPDWGDIFLSVAEDIMENI
jgi:hypothetical protein